MSKWLNPKCAVCGFRRHRVCIGQCNPTMVIKGAQHWVAINLKFGKERTLVDMDKGTHHDTSAHVSDMAQERWDYLHRPAKKR